MSKQLGRARVHSDIQTVLIVTKARDNRLIKLTRELALYLMLKPRQDQKRGLVVYVDSQLRYSRRFDAEGIRAQHPDLFIPFPRRQTSSSTSVSSSTSGTTKDDVYGRDDGQLRYWTSSMCSQTPQLFDFVVTLGGDGTVLFTSWLFQRIVPPVLSFALGSLGFLTNFDFADYHAVMDSALDSGIRVNLRMRFTCTVYRAVSYEEGTRQTFEVLNDLVVDRGPSPYVSLLELFGDEHHMTTVQADGLTVSTPTGSTAYSLSAGGSLVHPEIPAILITPICPHTLSFRPMLLPDSMELRICVPYNSRSTAWASFDGRGRIELKQGDHIKVTASKYPFPTVCADKQSTDWFHSISRTLKWNERERQKSFVVVEEESPVKIKKQNKQVTASERVNESAEEIEEEGEVSDEEEDAFDINDSSPDPIHPSSSAHPVSEEENKRLQKPTHTALEDALHGVLVSSASKKNRRHKSRSRSL
ncbi:NAD(+) kinase [Termitomyces sp. J132]|nr:NAD(+) kinase [Termitomyces sp. J132]